MLTNRGWNCTWYRRTGEVVCISTVLGHVGPTPFPAELKVSFADKKIDTVTLWGVYGEEKPDHKRFASLVSSASNALIVIPPPEEPQWWTWRSNRNPLNYPSPGVSSWEKSLNTTGSSVLLNFDGEVEVATVHGTIKDRGQKVTGLAYAGRAAMGLSQDIEEDKRWL